MKGKCKCVVQILYGKKKKKNKQTKQTKQKTKKNKKTKKTKTKTKTYRHVILL